MSRFFPLLVVLSVWALQLPAQTQTYPVYVYGNVADGDGYPVAGHGIRIIADSSSGFYYAAGAVTDRNGFFSDTLSVPQTVAVGVLSLYTGDCKGSLLRQDFKFTASQNKVEAKFLVCTRIRDFCKAYIQPDSSGTLYVQASGQEPFSYRWNTGASGARIRPSASGTYCVTVTDGSGCVTSACHYWAQNGDTLCKVYIKAEETPEGLMLHAGPSGRGPYTYRWTTGESGPSILVKERGEYCVAVADASGCISKDCYLYYGRNDTVDVEHYVISGVVLNCDTLTEDKLFGWVYLLRQEADDNFTLVDSTTYGPGFYAARYGFFRVPRGRYLIKVVPYGGEPLYFPGASDWKRAVLIEAPYEGERLFPVCLNRSQKTAADKPEFSDGRYTPKRMAPSLNLAPNPAHETLRLTFGDEPRPGSMLQLISMTGQVLRSWRPQDQVMELDVSDIPSGMYWFRLSDSGSVASARFIKE